MPVKNKFSGFLDQWEVAEKCTIKEALIGDIVSTYESIQEFIEKKIGMELLPSNVTLLRKEIINRS